MEAAADEFSGFWLEFAFGNFELDVESNGTAVVVPVGFAECGKGFFVSIQLDVDIGA